MKQLVVTTLLFIFMMSLAAQEKTEGFQFKTIYDLPATDVKDQYRTGTCWSFSGVSFLESEMLRKGLEPADISEMFIVKHCYQEKAEKYVRMHGHLNFSPGGAFHDVLYVLKKYGAMPESAFPGLNYGEESHVHGEMDEVLKGYVDGVLKNNNKKLSQAWMPGFSGVLDAYFGQEPESFSYKGKNYSPRTFADEVVKLNPDDYIQVTSYSHHPFYEPFIIEIPDNWLWGQVYNVPLADMMAIMDNSLKEGITIGWASDVSEKGFSFRNGVAVVPVTDVKEMEDTERSKWEKMTEAERQKQLYSFEGPITEKEITPEMRQEAFDDYLTTDDHGMHIVGMVVDQNGTPYYKVKNSWNTNNKYDGYMYASKAFVEFKTMSIMVHKDALPKEIRQKLGLK